MECCLSSLRLSFSLVATPKLTSIKMGGSFTDLDQSGQTIQVYHLKRALYANHLFIYNSITAIPATTARIFPTLEVAPTPEVVGMLIAVGDAELPLDDALEPYKYRANGCDTKTTSPVPGVPGVPGSALFMMTISQSGPLSKSTLSPGTTQ